MKLAKLLFGDTPVTKELKLLLLIGGLYALSVALSNTFVNVYLWKQKSEYMTIARFNLATVTSQLIVFILAGRWAKQVDRIIVLRLGVFFLSIFYLGVLIIGEAASQYVLGLGALLGIGYGFYWLAYNVLTFEITEPETRDIFNGFLGLLTSLAGMTGPFFAGWLITKMEKLTGYTIIFAISLGLFVISVLLSFLLKRRAAEGSFVLHKVLDWPKLGMNWKRTLWGNFALGLREGTFAFLITIWIYVAAGSEMGIGTYSLITSGVSLVAYYVGGRFIAKKQRKQSMFISSIGMLLAIFLLFTPTYSKLIVYGVLISILYPLLVVPLLSMSYDVIGQAPQAAKWRIEYVVARELFLNAGRIVSILVFMLAISLIQAEKAFPYILLLLGSTQLLIYVFMRKVELGE